MAHDCKRWCNGEYVNASQNGRIQISCVSIVESKGHCRPAWCASLQEEICFERGERDSSCPGRGKTALILILSFNPLYVQASAMDSPPTLFVGVDRTRSAARSPLDTLRIYGLQRPQPAHVDRTGQFQGDVLRRSLLERGVG